jgi:hypothetical protein
MEEQNEIGVLRCAAYKRTDNSKSNSRSPSGMTTRKAKTKTVTKAKAKAKNYCKSQTQNLEARKLVGGGHLEFE